MAKRKRRSFSKEYKAEVVALIRKSDKSIGAVASDLDLSETAVRRWVSQAEIDSGGGPAGAYTVFEGHRAFSRIGFTKSNPKRKRPLALASKASKVSTPFRQSSG